MTHDGLPNCSCWECNQPSQEIQDILAKNMTIYLDGVVEDNLSKYTAYKWYGGFTDTDGDSIKVEGYYNDTR